ncbi:uncharacterized protein LOC120779687 [Bactrocera tryoni]|uniref:uncharacterized protein LOC120779687 n=1 Tax=Bactrocera tryoni TaxID=59916 RepID=UPI001A95D4B0|nr:uncharacterized protein LOC120779687 [Bactrocera tryoni]
MERAEVYTKSQFTHGSFRFLTGEIDPQQRNIPNKEVMESEMIEEENDNVSNDIDIREQSTSKRFRTSSPKHTTEKEDFEPWEHYTSMQLKTPKTGSCALRV